MFRSLFFRFSASEPQLQSHLHDARISASCHITKAILPGIVEIPGRVIELRMIEDVESFRAELELLGFLDLGVLQQREIEVVDAGSDKEPAHLISDLAKRLLHKVVWIEVGKTVAWVPVRKQFVPVGGVAGRVNRSQKCPAQRVVVAFSQLNRLSAGKAAVVLEVKLALPGRNVHLARN